MQRNYEKAVEERLQTLLDKAVGAGKSVARVNAVFNFKQVEKFEERYDPEATVVRSEQRTEEKNGAATSASGIPGVQSNLGKAAPTAPAAASNQGSRSDETMNYEISRSTARIIEPVGTLSQISVAILVDGKYDASSASGKDAKPKYQPRSAEELQKIEALAKGAVGFNMERGDQVTVANIPFQDEAQADKDSGESWWNLPIVSAVLKNLLIGMGFLALLFFVIRPMLAMLRTERRPEPESFSPLHDSDEQLPNQSKAALAMYTMNQMELIEKVKNDPYQTAQILQNWLRKRE